MMTKPGGLISALPALLLALALPQQLSAQQETQRHYRIELIVVRHLAGSSDTAPEQELRDLSAVLDLYAPDPESTTAPASPAAGESGTNAADSQSTGGELSEDLPPAVRIDDMSDTMREAWRRLRGSANFRPELFRAWEQSGDSPFPRLRIHDDEILFTFDPTAQSLAAVAPVDEHGALVFSDASVQREAETDLGLNEETENPITNFYRIDGTAKLIRSRFLNLDLDIELREPLFEPAATESITEPTTEPDGTPTLAAPVSSPSFKSGPAAAAPAFRIHRIQQRRQVKAQQMEYFDGPVIGVLAFVTGFDVSATNAESAVVQP